MLSRPLRQQSLLRRHFRGVDQSGGAGRLLDSRVPRRHRAFLAHGIRVALRSLEEPLDMVVVAGSGP